MECGFPRNDMLFPKNVEEVSARIRKDLGVSQEDKLVLYAPTFRDDGSTEAYNIPSEEILAALGEEWKLVIRLHPNVNPDEVRFAYNEKIINGSVYPDMQELLIVADILVTDYSSSIFEFSVLKKPSYIYATDIEEYQAMRGLNESFFHMPYKICKTDEEFLTEIKKYTPEVGREAADKFVELFGGVDKGNASELVVKRISDVIENKL